MEVCVYARRASLLLTEMKTESAKSVDSSALTAARSSGVRRWSDGFGRGAEKVARADRGVADDAAVRGAVAY